MIKFMHLVGATAVIAASTAALAQSNTTKPYKDRGFEVVTTPPVAPPSASKSTAADQAKAIKTLELRKQAPEISFNEGYGKIRFELGDGKLESETKARSALETHLRGIVSESFSSEEGNYSLILTISKRTGAATVEMFKEIIASAKWQNDKFLGMTVNSQYQAQSLRSGLIQRGIPLTQSTNTYRASLQLVRAEKASFDFETGQKAANLYKQATVHQLVSLATPLAPGAAALSDFVKLVFDYKESRDVTSALDMQFIPADNQQVQKVWTIGNVPVLGLFFELEPSLFKSWDLPSHKFINPDANEIWAQAIYYPKDKHAIDLLRDDMPAEIANASWIRKYITDVQTKSPPADGIASCYDVYDLLKHYFALHDAAAIYWSWIRLFQPVLSKNVENYKSCFTKNIKAQFDRFNLQYADLE